MRRLDGPVVGGPEAVRDRNPRARGVLPESRRNEERGSWMAGKRLGPVDWLRPLAARRRLDGDWMGRTRLGAVG